MPRSCSPTTTPPGCSVTATPRRWSPAAPVNGLFAAGELERVAAAVTRAHTPEAGREAGRLALTALTRTRDSIRLIGRGARVQWGATPATLLSFVDVAVPSAPALVNGRGAASAAATAAAALASVAASAAADADVDRCCARAAVRARTAPAGERGTVPPLRACGGRFLLGARRETAIPGRLRRSRAGARHPARPDRGAHPRASSPIIPPTSANPITGPSTSTCSTPTDRSATSSSTGRSRATRA